MGKTKVTLKVGSKNQKFKGLVSNSVKKSAEVICVFVSGNSQFPFENLKSEEKMHFCD